LIVPAPTFTHLPVYLSVGGIAGRAALVLNSKSSPSVSMRKLDAPLNMFNIVLKLTVLHPDISRLLRLLAPSNILLICVTISVFQPDKFRFVRLHALLNTRPILVTLPVSQADTSPTVVKEFV